MQSNWVFGYGSLMWRPGFRYLERHKARVDGLHRSLCVYSHVHRGTPDKPGLVLALDDGGFCEGVAFRVDECDWEETCAYLRAREQVTMVYLETRQTVRLHADEPQEVEALCFVVDTSHMQYAGRLDLETQARLVRDGVGQSGKNPEYLENTVLHLREMQIHDHDLEALFERVNGGLRQDSP